MIPTQRMIASKSPEGKKKKKLGRVCVCVHRIAFQKLVFTVEPPRCHVDLTYVPTHAENHPSAHKGEYIYIQAHTNWLQLLPAVAKKNSCCFPFLLQLTVSCWRFSLCGLLEIANSEEC